MSVLAVILSYIAVLNGLEVTPRGLVSCIRAENKL